jgi:hypothetical protein
MTITISDIATTVSRYLDTYPAEKAGLEPLLLALGAGGDSILSRAGLPGHVTCSAAVLDGRGGVLMVKHRVLDMWLIPGGHIEPADDSLLSAALRELDEEYIIKARRPDTITIQAEEVSSYNWLLPSLLHHRRLTAKIAPVAAT